VNNVGFGEPNLSTAGRIASLSGTPQQMLDSIRRYEDAGVSYIVMGRRGRSVEDMVDTI